MKRTMFCGFTLSASTLAMMTVCGAASAQDIETVTSTGVRASPGAGANQISARKRDAADRLDRRRHRRGKLLDTTVVESLRHVTGISIIRNSVEPSTVLIRGLPDIQTLVNGREMFTSVGRAISLPDLPSELLAQVDVHKASSATPTSREASPA